MCLVRKYNKIYFLGDLVISNAASRYAEASNFCSHNSAQLVTFHSESEYNEVIDWVWNHWEEKNDFVGKGFWTDMTWIDNVCDMLVFLSAYF